jgi:alginate O-acetyltransferase complex protein AlgI
MLFNSIEFSIFFPVVLIAYYAIPHRGRWALLLVASYYFYMCWIPQYILLLLFSTLIDYVAGFLIFKSEGMARKIYLAISLFCNLVVLFFFKYFAFLLNNLAGIYSYFREPPDWFTVSILLPVGISFYTFQSMSYTIDIYRGETKPEPNFGIFALYVSFFPQLVAGPIERSTSLLPQIKQKHTLDCQSISDGLKLMAWGFFKKLVIADHLALYVNQVFANPEQYHGLTLVVGSIFFYFQLYADFSGYSDIAVGAAQTLGIKLNRNFLRPLLSTSMPDKWKRWHISLGAWFRDYLYLPLKNTKFFNGKRSLLMIVVWTLIGLWHGANWNFIAWGLIHCTYLLFSSWSKGLRQQFVKFLGLVRYPLLHRIIRMTLVFIMNTFAVTFFRSASVSDGIVYMRNMFSQFSLSVDTLTLEGFSLYDIKLAVLTIIAMESVNIYQEYLYARGKNGIRATLAEKPLPLRMAVYGVLLLMTVNYGITSSNEYIYFQF